MRISGLDRAWGEEFIAGGQGGQTTAQISRRGTNVTLAIDDRDPSIGDFGSARLNELYAAFLNQEALLAPHESGNKIGRPNT